MGNQIDLEVGAADQPGTEPASPPEKSPAEENYKERYAGQVRVYNKLAEKHAALQRQYDDLTTSYEEKLNELRTAKSGLEKQLQEVGGVKSQLETEKAKLEGQVSIFQKRQELQTAVSQKYPNLMELAVSGDLKLPTEFDKPEDFEAYLERMSKYATPAQQQRGAVTPPPPRRPAGDVGRTIADVQRDLDEAAGGDPKRFNELIDELTELQKKAVAK